ncbi:replication factor C subunit [Pelagophyceae sp. CCMP2097]|nr:replication factor C subunit [Pelagophyceae sp. CCMP2097]
MADDGTTTEMVDDDDDDMMHAEAPVQSKAIPWVEKYRPKDVKDVAAQEEIVRSLLGAIEQGSLPHLLFYGPPGTGKTSTILALTRMLYAPEVWRDRVLEMNASDERGIKVVREKVKKFAQRTVGNVTYAGYPSPPFKIVILDEADTMTREAQGALRRTIETFASSTRFCLVCNYVSRIIEPLASRCAKFRFAPLDSVSMLTRLKFIAGEEEVFYTAEVYDKILECSRGDMRRAVQLLQSCANYYGKDGAVDAAALDEVSGEVPPRLVSDLWAAIRSKSFERTTAIIETIMLEGFPALATMRRLHDDIVDDENIPDAAKADITEYVARADKNLADSADDALQLQDVVAHILQKLK